jgi:hypothetical protein
MAAMRPHGALGTTPVQPGPLWQRGCENAPPSKLHRTLGIVPLRLLTMRLGEKGPDTGFIRRGPQRRNGYRAGAIHYAKQPGSFLACLLA